MKGEIFMQISAEYDFIFDNENAAKRALEQIERVMAEKGYDFWSPNHYYCTVMTYGEYVDWDIFEDLVTELVKQIAISNPEEEFSGTSLYDNMSTGDTFGIKILYKENILTLESGTNILNNSEGTKFCPYCGEAYDVESISEDIESGEFELNEDGSFNCFQCDMEISLDELEADGGPSITTTYKLEDGAFILG